MPWGHAGATLPTPLWGGSGKLFLLDLETASTAPSFMLYTGQNIHLPHSLFYSWTGWPIEGGAFEGALSESHMSPLRSAWQADGMTLQSFKQDSQQIQATFAVLPDIAPSFCAARAKGRLQHSFRQAGRSCAFSRKVSVRALGKNITKAVVDYVRDQLKHVDLADPRYVRELAESAHEDATVDLRKPVELKRSRYWYNLHVVFVTAARYRMGGPAFLSRLRNAFLQTPAKHCCRVGSLAIMPDHAHVVLQGDPEKSPKELGLAFQNQTAAAAGCRFWQDEFYVGTFSEYDLGAIGE